MNAIEAQNLSKQFRRGAETVRAVDGIDLTIGAGGIFVELLKDSAVMLLPVSREEVGAALDSLKIAPLIRGYRGRPGADRNAIIDDVMTVGGKTARPEMLAAEALKIMQDFKINSLPVVNDQQQAIGALNMHDLLRAGVM